MVSQNTICLCTCRFSIKILRWSAGNVCLQVVLPGRKLLFPALMLTPRGGGVLYVGYLIINCIPILGILISILAPSWGNLNRMTFINIVFIAIYCKMVWHLTNIYCLTVGHLIENLLKKSNAPPMPDPPPPSGA